MVATVQPLLVEEGEGEVEGVALGLVEGVGEAEGEAPVEAEGVGEELGHSSARMAWLPVSEK